MYYIYNIYIYEVRSLDAAAADAGRILETCQAPIHHAPGLEYIAGTPPRSDFIPFFSTHLRLHHAAG